MSAVTSAVAMASMRSANTRSLMESQSIESTWAWTPRRAASVTVRAASAASTYIFVGMHPTLRHVPPKRPSSTNAMRRSSKAGDGIELPDPVPMMIRSYCRALSLVKASPRWLGSCAGISGR